MGVINDVFGRPMAILLLEDDVDLQRVFQCTVDGVPEDLTLVTCTSQESEVARLAALHSVDCVFVDDSLPRRPWTAVVEELRAKCPEARVVLWTERPSAPLLEEALDHGARYVLKKGVAPEVVVGALKDVLDDERRRHLRLAQFGEPDDGGGGGARTQPTQTGPVQGHVIALGSGIVGGTGKSTAVSNMAVWLANNPFRRFSTAVLDIEKDVGSISSFFPGTPPEPSILAFSDYAGAPAIPPEVLKAKLRVDTEAARKYRLDLVFGACDLELEDRVTEDLVRTMLVSLRLSHQFVLVDLPADLTDGAVAAMEQASRVLWLIRDYQPDLTRTARAFQKLRQLGVDTTRIQVVLSRVDPRGHMQFSPRQVHETLGTTLMGHAIPEDPTLKPQARAYKFAAREDPDGKYMDTLRKILEEIQPGTGFPMQAARPGGRVRSRRGGWLGLLRRPAKAGVN